MWALRVFLLTLTCGYIRGDEASWRCEDGLPDTTVVLGFQDKCYQFVDREVFWTSARNYCQLYGGRLVKINDPYTNEFIVKSLNALPWKNKGVWIGLHDRDEEHHWEWVTENGNYGEMLLWTNWGRGHPRAFLHTMRDCIRMVRGSGDWKWHETFCSALNWRYKFICEYRMRPVTSAPRSANFYQDNSERSEVAIVPKNAQVESAYKHVEEREETTSKLPVTKDSDVYDYDYTKEQEADLEDLIEPLALKEKEMENQRGLTFVVLACTVGIISAVIILIIILVSRRRRRHLDDKTMKIENPMYDTACDNDTDVTGARVQNEYVINVYSNPLPLAVRLLNIKRQEAENAILPPSEEKPNSTSADGDGYEEPRKNVEMTNSEYDTSPNVYSEIPELYSENLYESLDEIQLPSNESEA